MKEIRDWLTFVFSVLALPALAWAWFTIQQSIDLKSAARDLVITQTYETKAGHDADVRTMTECTAALREGQANDRLSIQHLTDVMATRRGDGVPRQTVNNTGL